MPRSGRDRWFNAKHETSDKSPYLDPSDVKAHTQQNTVIDFYHGYGGGDNEGTKNSISFKAFITEYSDSFEVQYGADLDENLSKIWHGELTKPLRTVRKISLSWKTVAASQAEAKENMERITELSQMLYGVLIVADGAVDGVDSSAGEIRVRFAQWIVDPSVRDPGQFAPADTTGLQCRMPSLNFSPDLEQGSFDTPEGIFPKVYNISCNLTYQPRYFTESESGGSTEVAAVNVGQLPSGLDIGGAQGAATKQASDGIKRTPFGYRGLARVEGREGAPPRPSDERKNKADDEYDAHIADRLTR